MTATFPLRGVAGGCPPWLTLCDILRNLPRCLDVGHRSTQVTVERVEELPRVQVRRVRPDEQREVLRHLAALDRLDADPLQRAGELREFRRAVELAAVREPARPGEDRR